MKRGRELDPYLDPDAREARVDALADACAGEIVEVGKSARGAALRAVRVPALAPTPARVLCCANIHGPEWIGGLVALGLLERLAADSEPEAQRLRRRAEVWILPCLNPDGYARTWERAGIGTLAELRTNHNGVDLNRNFPLPGGARPRMLPGAGSSRPTDATYRGTSPLSEPETRALVDLCESQRFVAAADMHSFMGTVIPARVTSRGDYATYRALARAFARAQPQVRYRRLASRIFDVFTGEQEDHLHHVLGCWAVCVESFPLLASYRQHLRAPSLFWRFNPREPQRWIDNDVPGLVAYFHAALDHVAASAAKD